MPKISRSRRHRRLHPPQQQPPPLIASEAPGTGSSAGALNRTSPRLVSDEDLQPSHYSSCSSPTASSSAGSGPPSRDMGEEDYDRCFRSGDTRPRLKRRAPSDCLVSLLMSSSDEPASPSSSFWEIPTSEALQGRRKRAARDVGETSSPSRSQVSPESSPWGHFIDMTSLPPPLSLSSSSSGETSPDYHHHYDQSCYKKGDYHDIDDGIDDGIDDDDDDDGLFATHSSSSSNNTLRGQTRFLPSCPAPTPSAWSRSYEPYEDHHYRHHDGLLECSTRTYRRTGSCPVRSLSNHAKSRRWPIASPLRRKAWPPSPCTTTTTKNSNNDDLSEFILQAPSEPSGDMMMSLTQEALQGLRM